MSELVKISDYVAAGQRLAMQQYAEKPNVQALLAAFLTHCQTIEDAFFPLATDRFLVTPTTSGATLDSIGDLVGIGRNGLDDATYRLLIQAKIADNRGDATLPTLLRVVRQLFNADAVFEKSPNSFARSGQARGAWLALMVGSPKVPARLYPLVAKLVAQAIPAGVELAHLGVFQSKTFAFAGPQPWVGGFGDVNDSTVGAPLATLLTSSGS